MSCLQRFSIRGLLAGLALLAALPVCAQEYPNRTVTLYTPTGAGGTVDAALRFYAEKFREKTGQVLVIDNKVGAGGNIAGKAAATSKPDGYSLFVGDTSTMGANRFLYKSLAYDPVNDFVPIERLFRLAFVIAVNPEKTPVNTVQELTSFLKRKGAPINFGYFTPTMLALSAQYATLTGLDAAQVGYRSSPQMRSELATGQIDYVFTDAVVATTPQQGVKPLAIASDERSSLLPNMPTMTEAGVPNFRPLYSWFGIYAPTGTPAPIIKRAAAVLHEITLMKETRDFLATFAGEPFPAGGDELLKFQEEFLQRWAYLVKLAKIEPQ
jgi:tripartite-type tricarboxylate transporter receptor subunit TctC